MQIHVYLYLIFNTEYVKYIYNALLFFYIYSLQHENERKTDNTECYSLNLKKEIKIKFIFICKCIKNAYVPIWM